MIENVPGMWKRQIPKPKPGGHKYDRGHCVVIGGAKLTGAARLAAAGAARIGAGLTTIIASPGTGTIYRETTDAHIMIEDEQPDRCSQLQDPRRNALVLGPGFGPDPSGISAWLSARGPQRLVLDADGLTHLKDFALLRREDVLTPHAGEFQKLFGDISPQEAAIKAKCVVVLKGAKTIITDGNDVIENDHASPYLASAGTGDVLAGMIGGLLAQGMHSLLAAAAAVWIHGEAGMRIGPGLVASDIPDAVPGILQSVIGE